MTKPPITYRQEVRAQDVEIIRDIVRSAHFFNEQEVDIAVELLETRLDRGVASGYYFLFAEREGRVLGYTCFGPVYGTMASYELYWIAVHNDFRRGGLGKTLISETEKIMTGMGCQRSYAETSSRDQYAPTRAFYEKSGYIAEAVIRDFYAPGDSKIIYVKVFNQP